MKTIQLQHVKDEVKNIDFDQATQLQFIVDQPTGGQGSVPIPEMRRLLKISEKIEAVIKGGKPYEPLDLEDAEWELVNQKVQAFPWPRAMKVYLDFADLVEKAPSKSDVAGVETEPAKEEAKAAAQ